MPPVTRFLDTELWSQHKHNGPINKTEPPTWTALFFNRLSPDHSRGPKNWK